METTFHRMYQIQFIYHPTQTNLPKTKIELKYGVREATSLGSHRCKFTDDTWITKFSIDPSIFNASINSIWIQYHNQNQVNPLTTPIPVSIDLIRRQNQHSFQWTIDLTSEVKMIRVLEPYCHQYNIHTPQYQTSLDLVQQINSGQHHLILVAEMQSGKTGVAKSVVYNLTHSCGFQPENLFFICGMNDNNLLHQTQTEFESLIPTENIYFQKTIQSLLNKTTSISPVKSEHKTLIIIDESHYASNKDSMIYQFLKNIMGVTADGNTSTWSNQNAYILSISATPMGEIANQNLSHGDKYFTKLPTGLNYFGVNDMLTQQLLHQSYNLSQITQRQLFTNLIKQILIEQQETGDFKYCVVRISSQTTRQHLETAINHISQHQVIYINYHSVVGSNLVDFNDLVENKPTKLTMIWIYDSLRAGKQLQTQHLYLVHDTHACQPDVAAQGLAGRLCGYNKAVNQVRCYTNVPSMMKYIDWLKHDYSKGRIPAGAKDIIGGFDATSDNHWTGHVPILFQMTPTLIAYCQKHRTENGKNTYTEDFKVFARDQINNPIFQTHHPAKNGGFMILDTLNKPSSLQTHWINNYNAYNLHKVVNGFVTQNTNSVHHQVYYVFLNLVPNHVQFGWGLICYKDYVSDLSLKTAQVTTTETNLYHAKTWTPKIKIRLKNPPKTNNKIST